MYRLGLEAILDVTKRGDSLLVNPRVPSAWREFSIEYRRARSIYAILVRSPADLDGDVVAVSLDGREVDGPAITLIDDGARLRVIIEPRAARPADERDWEPSRSLRPSGTGL